MKKMVLSSVLLVSLLLAANSAEAAETKVHKVKSGDTLSEIAKKEYEEEGLYYKLAAFNKIENASLIFIGEEIELPSLEELSKVEVTQTAPVDNSQQVVEQPQTQQEQYVEEQYVEEVQQPQVNVSANDGSPQYAAERMAAATGTDVSTWLYIIEAESSNNPHIVNSIGCYGYFQIHPVHGMPAGASVDTQIQYAIQIYNSQGFGAWEVM